MLGRFGILSSTGLLCLEPPLNHGNSIPLVILEEESPSCYKLGDLVLIVDPWVVKSMGEPADVVHAFGQRFVNVGVLKKLNLKGTNNPEM